MYHNYTFSDSTDALPRLLGDLLDRGDEVGSRNGRVRELTHVGITLTSPLDRELLVRGRRPNLAAQIAESAWILAGRNDIDWLSHYLPRAGGFSDDGRTWRGGYGPRMRRWPVRDGEGTSFVDQVRYVVETLTADPLSRRAVISLWDPQVDTSPGKDLPCNDFLTFTSRLGRLDLAVTLRSNDAFWGWSGINVFEWSVLQEVVAHLLGINVGSLHFNTTSLHVYDRHWERARKISEDASTGTSAASSPRFDLGGRSASVDDLDEVLDRWFGVERLLREGLVVDDDGADVDDLVRDFPEPMLRSWLQVLQWWWNRDLAALRPISHTRLGQAALFSIQPPDRSPSGPAGPEINDVYAFARPGPIRSVITRRSDFVEAAVALHEEKHRAYGDSWKRRGEMLGILANIARKVDRLGGSETSDETSTDTAMDLLIYLAKYRTWLSEKGIGAASDGAELVAFEHLSDHPKYTEEILQHTEVRAHRVPKIGSTDVRERLAQAEDYLTHQFDLLEKAVREDDPIRRETVDDMLLTAYAVARARWEKDEWKAENAGRFWRGYEA